MFDNGLVGQRMNGEDIVDVVVRLSDVVCQIESSGTWGARLNVLQGHKDADSSCRRLPDASLHRFMQSRRSSQQDVSHHYWLCVSFSSAIRDTLVLKFGILIKSLEIFEDFIWNYVKYNLHQELLGYFYVSIPS